jgi:hypothetical protein
MAQFYCQPAPYGRRYVEKRIPDFSAIGEVDYSSISRALLPDSRSATMGFPGRRATRAHWWPL